MRTLITVVVVGVGSLVGCGPGARDNGDDGSGGAVVDAPPCTAQLEVCDDGVDNDCDDRPDCADPDCSGVGACPVCGAVQVPMSTPLALPDGISSGTACSTDAQCTGAGTPNCVSKECHASYTSTLDFIGFGQGQKLDDPTKLLSVCVKAEHSWLRDLQVELINPDGAVFILRKWIDRTTIDEVYLGHANDSDAANNPVAGDGYEYCWTPSATLDMYTAPRESWNGHDVLPSGNYLSSAPWAALAGSPLNGMWTMRVTDLWGIDNGFMFEWKIAFDPSLVSDCSGPIIQ